MDPSKSPNPCNSNWLLQWGFDLLREFRDHFLPPFGRLYIDFSSCLCFDNNNDEDKE